MGLSFELLVATGWVARKPVAPNADRTDSRGPRKLSSAAAPVFEAIMTAVNVHTR